MKVGNVEVEQEEGKGEMGEGDIGTEGTLVAKPLVS